MGGRGPARFRFRLLFHRRVRRSVRRVHGRPARAPAKSRRRSALQSRDHARRSVQGPATSQIKVPSAVACEACGGTGAEAGTQARAMPDLLRRRQGARAAGLLHHRAHLSRSAAAPAGSSSNPCKPCNGAGHVPKERTLQVDIPPGVEEGTRIRLSGEGQAGMNGGPAGDLYIFVSRRAQHRDLPARRTRSLLPRAGIVRHRRARRHDRSADARRRTHDK